MGRGVVELRGLERFVLHTTQVPLLDEAGFLLSSTAGWVIGEESFNHGPWPILLRMVRASRFLRRGAQRSPRRSQRWRREFRALWLLPSALRAWSLLAVEKSHGESGRRTGQTGEHSLVRTFPVGS